MVDAQAAFAMMVRQSSLGIVDMFEEGRCSRCGGCCGRHLPITESDLDRLNAFLAHHEVRPVRSELMCPFLRDGACEAYEARPMICRVYTCHGHLTGEIADDPRNALMGSAVCVDMQRMVFDGLDGAADGHRS